MTGGLRALSIPAKYSDDNQRLELAGIALLFQRKYEEAIKLFESQYSLLLEAEKRTEKPIHKGAPLYNWGIALVAEKRRAEGVQKIVSALVEDFISVGTESAAKGQAWRFLAGVGFRDEQLRSIGDQVRESIRKPEDALITEKLMTSVFDSLKTRIQEILEKQLLTRMPKEGALEAKPRNILAIYGISLSGNDGDRVFLGGSYRNIALLKEIEVLIKVRLIRKNLIPELVSNHTAGKQIADKDMHGLCMGILDRCGYAVFEVSFESGALMEVEHCHNRLINNPSSIRVALVWQRETKTKRNKPPVSSMMMAAGFTRKPYIDLADLIGVLNKFFK